MNHYSAGKKEDVLIELQEGGSIAFKIIFERFYTRLCVFADRYLNDAEASKDVVNEVFVKFWKDPKRFENIDHVLANLYLATKHMALNRRQSTIRSMARDYLYQSNSDMEAPSYFAEITRSEMLSELYEAISQLPPQARRIIYSTYIDGKSNQEVAQEMGITAQTLRNQKSRGLSLLRNKLDKDSFDLLIWGALAYIYNPNFNYFQ